MCFICRRTFPPRIRAVPAEKFFLPEKSFRRNRLSVIRRKIRRAPHKSLRRSSPFFRFCLPFDSVIPGSAVFFFFLLIQACLFFLFLEIQTAAAARIIRTAAMLRMMTIILLLIVSRPTSASAPVSSACSSAVSILEGVC